MLVDQSRVELLSGDYQSPVLTVEPQVDMLVGWDGIAPPVYLTCLIYSQVPSLLGYQPKCGCVALHLAQLLSGAR